MTPLRLGILAAAFSLPATAAIAQVYVAPDELVDPIATDRARFAAADEHVVLEGSVALDWGVAHASPLPGVDFAIGPAVELGARLGRLAVVSQYSVEWLAPIIPNGSVDSKEQQQVVTPGSTSTSTSAPSSNGDAFEQRLGVALRYSLLRHVVPGRVNHRTRGVQGSLWLEGGMGEERIDYEGNHFDRRDVELGVGGEFDWRGRSYHAGQFWALRLVLAPPLPSNEVTCGGTCTSQPSGLDKGLLAVYGWNFGG